MIDNRSVQRALAAKRLYLGPIDGVIGSGSQAAIRKAIEPFRQGRSWTLTGERIAFEQLMMQEAGVAVGKIDGVPGPKYEAGVVLWQRKLREGTGLPDAPAHQPTAFPRQRDAAAFYGDPGTGHIRIQPPYPVFYGGKPVSSILIHQRCASSAVRAMERVKAAYSPEAIRQHGFDDFGGCFNNRPMRGGSALSMHAYACAIDWNASRNPLKADHRTAYFARPECAAFLDAWEAEGWISLGRERDFDWMHVQAARL